MKVLTVKEAVERVIQGDTLEGVVLDENTTQQVNVRDAMILSRGGIVIPEQNIYYKDEEIEYDEDIDELVVTSGLVDLSWEEKAKRASEHTARNNKKKEIAVDLSTQEPEIDDWLAANRDKVAALLRPIVISLFEAEKTVKG